MAQLKLTYFDFHGGRGEPARLALFIGGIAFEDDRVKPADWARRKSETPFGALPVLEVDGQTVAQSNAINRYVGKLADLYPSDPWQAALCDETMRTSPPRSGRPFLFRKSKRRRSAVCSSRARSRSISPDSSRGSKHTGAGTSRPIAYPSRILRSSFGFATLSPEHSIMCRPTCPTASRQSCSSTTNGLRATRA